MGSFFQLEGPIGRNLARIVDVLLLNLIFILFSLPVVTIGASLTALYTVSFKMARGEDPSVWRNFTKAFKKNLKQSSLVWFLLIGIAVILLGDIYYLVYAHGIWKVIFMSLTLFFGFLYLTLLLIIFPYIAVPIVFFLSSFTGFLTGVYFITFGGFSILAFVNSFIFKRIFSKYEIKKGEEA